MEFYFQDQLRWSYGFDNPNKSAALIASLLPLVWILMGAAARIQKPALKWSGIWVVMVILWAGWWFLFKTYSRGGIVAAFLGFAYIAFSLPLSRSKNWRLILIGIVGVMVLFISTQAATRSVGWVGTHEGSVENRLSAWRGGLEMLAENPRGVGLGKSGEAYLQWYQPIEMTDHYRTLVNSYLTFAVEQGMAVFSIAFFAVMIVWNITRSSKTPGFSNDICTGLRASLLSLGVAGIFSTTMEESTLWILPLLCIAGLLGIKWRTHQWDIGVQLRRCAIISLALCGIIFALGCWLVHYEPIRIILSRHGPQNATLEPRGEVPSGSLCVMVDEQVMGDDYGKLLRRLCVETGMRISLSETTDGLGPHDTVMAAGDRVNSLRDLKGETLILLAPSRVEQVEADKIVENAKSVTLLLPGFDEDQRVAFWTDFAGTKTNQTHISVHSLEGVGTRVDWAWDAVILAVARVRIRYAH